MKKPKLPKRLKKPKLPKNMQRPFEGVSERLPAKVLKAQQSSEERLTEALSNVPRITNETVSEHREEVLSSARKLIYPLQHSKHRVVRISLALLGLVLVGSLIIICLSLYRFQNTNGFVYNVTRIVPFPVAKAGNSWISYESYLFELRRNLHYYQTQQGAGFDTKEGKDQLHRLKRQAMDQVVRDAYVKQLATKNGVSVSGQAVDNQVTLVRNENRLGNSERVFREVLNEFWGWNEDDFKRELRQQMLQQAVVAKLDTNTNQRAETAYQKLKGGADFAKLATEVSDDLSTKATGGAYPEPISVNDRDIPPLLAAAIFKLKKDELSGIINSGYTLDIAKVTEITDNSRRAAHIQFNFKDISAYIKPVQSKNPPHKYIKI
jgi:parvulin-like peptidyl-prolyl isomerase